MTELIIEKFSWFIKLSGNPIDKVKVNELPTHKTVRLSYEKCSLLFNFDRAKKEIWINIIYPKKLNSNAYPVRELNVDFLLSVFDKSFEVDKKFDSLEERIEYYSKLIRENFSKLVSPGKSSLLKAIKYRDKHFESSFGSTN